MRRSFDEPVAAEALRRHGNDHVRPRWPPQMRFMLTVEMTPHRIALSRGCPRSRRNSS